jgi:hypothetical protein
MKKHMKTQRQDAAAPKKTRGPRKWLWALGIALIFILLIVLLVPVVLSSGGFTRWVQARISHSTGGQANIGDLTVGWLKGVRVADFRFRGENGWAQVDIDRITTQPSYSSLLTGTLALDRTVIEQPRIAIDLRERPTPTDGEAPQINADDLARLNDVTVRDGSIQLTGRRGETVRVADLNSTLSMRRPGRTSRFDVDMVVAQANQPGRIQAAGQVTPDRRTGWSLRGTTGDLTAEVNDLNLSSLAPFLELAGVQVQAGGQVSANITGAIKDGQIENLNATVVGKNIDVTGEALQGDRLQTAQLNVKANLAQAEDVVKIDQLNVETDWATVSATGTLPKTPQSLAQLLESGTAYDVRGNFDVDLAAVLSQMPNTLGVRKGMEITGGRATGTIDTVTEAGRATLVAKTQVAGLAGTVDGKKLDLSEPVLATARLSSDDRGAQLESLNVSAPFAKINASGSFEQIKYDGQVNLASLQSELGPLINLGDYEIAGQMTAQGQISVEEEATNISGSLSARQVVLAAPDGHSVSEPQADIDFAVGLREDEQVLAVDALKADASFGTISIKDAIVPMGPGSPAPLNLAVTASDVDLGRLKPYAVFFASFPQKLTLGGIAQSQVHVTKEEGTYHISSEATRIQDFQLVAPEKEPFAQKQVTALFNIYVNPNRKEIDVEDLQIQSPQMRIRFGELSRTSQDGTAKVQGELDGQVDWAAVGQAVSLFLPDRLDMAGRRQVAINFTSTYPVEDRDGLLANLDSRASFGFDRAEYMGFNVGSTDVNILVDDGLMRIGPFSTTVNNGTLNFAGRANLGQTPALLSVPAPVSLFKGIEINEQTTEKLLKYVNPIFADTVGVTGVASFELQELAFPLTGGNARARLVGTLSIDRLQLGASTLLNQILGAFGESVRGQTLTVRPTKITLRDRVVRYDNMQVDVGDNPVNFSGAVGPDGRLDMTVVLPYTIEGRTVRVGEEGRAGPRIALPLTGTIEKPELNLKKLPETLLKEQIFKGLEDILRRR